MTTEPAHMNNMRCTILFKLAHFACCLVGPDMALLLMTHGGLVSTSDTLRPAKRLFSKRRDEIDSNLSSIEEKHTLERLFMMGRLTRDHFEERE